MNKVKLLNKNKETENKLKEEFFGDTNGMIRTILERAWEEYDRGVLYYNLSIKKYIPELKKLGFNVNYGEHYGKCICVEWNVK